MKHLLAVLAFAPAILLAEPRPPMDMNLDEKTIHRIPIHAEIDTLLVFPREVTLIAGHGLTTGEQPGKVYCQQAEDAKFVVLRQLEKNGTVLMQAVIDGRAFVFSLSGSDQPASVIRFHVSGQAPTALEIAASDVGHTKRTVTKERLRELVRLAREATFLKVRIPHEYAGFVSKRVSISSQLQGYVRAEITGLARFQNEDTLIVFGRLRNEGKKDVQVDEAFRLQVGDKRRYAFSTIDIASKRLQPGEGIVFSAALVGDGQGKPLHLSLDNRFAIQLAKSS